MQYAGLTQVKRSISQQTLWLAPVLHRIGALLNVARTDLGIFLFVYPRSWKIWNNQCFLEQEITYDRATEN